MFSLTISLFGLNTNCLCELMLVAPVFIFKISTTSINKKIQMAKLSYLYNENFLANVKTLMERGIGFTTSYTEKGGAILVVDDKDRALITEFSLAVYFPLDEAQLGFQIYGNGDNYYHKSNEYITDARIASELLHSAKETQPDLPWHIKILNSGSVENPQLLNSIPDRISNDDLFSIEPAHGGFNIIYPRILGGTAAFADSEQRAYEILISTRMGCPIGSKYSVKEPLQCAQSLWDLFSEVPIDNDVTVFPFLGFSEGTCRFKILKWFEQYFDISITRDLVTNI